MEEMVIAERCQLKMTVAPAPMVESDTAQDCGEQERGKQRELGLDVQTDGRKLIDAVSDQ